MNTQHLFELFISYSQIAVFIRNLDNPFNDWTEDEARQGFSWRPGSASFRTRQGAGKCQVEVIESSFFEFNSEDCIRAIEVPFELPRRKEVEIASISDGQVVSVSPGKFQLRFEAFEHNFIRIYFLRNGAFRFKVLLADSELDVPAKLSLKTKR